MENVHTITLSPETSLILKKMREVVSNDMVRPTLTFLHYTSNGKTGTIEGTDGFLLGWYDFVEIEEKFEELMGNDGMFKILVLTKDYVTVEVDTDNLSYARTKK